MFFEALAADLRQHGMLERAAEKAAAEAMLAVAQQLCGCDVMRTVLGRLAAERIAARRKAEELEYDRQEAAMLASRHGMRFTFAAVGDDDEDGGDAGTTGGGGSQAATAFTGGAPGGSSFLQRRGP